MPISLGIIYGSNCRVEQLLQRSYGLLNRNICYLALYRKSLLTLGLEGGSI